MMGFERGDAESGMQTARMVSLAIFIFLFLILQRPLCKYLCPYGALFGFFNLISPYRYKVDMNKCTKCGQCTKKCKMDIAVYKAPNQMECVRCKDCIKACPFKAIDVRSVPLTFPLKNALSKSVKSVENCFTHKW
jgi:polyferredoxin